MPMQPGSPQAQMPPGEDALIRRIQEIERVVREDRAAAARAVAPWSARTDDGGIATGTQIIAGDPGGSRVELDSAGLRKYAADGTTVQVDLTGDVAAFSGLITGSEIIAGTAGAARIELDAAGLRQYAADGTTVLLDTADDTTIRSRGGNIAVGADAQPALTTGFDNTALGTNAQQALTTGYRNTAVGPGAQQVLTEGLHNTAVGAFAQSELTTGNHNTAVGRAAQRSPLGVVANATATASYQTSIGPETGQSSATQVDGITTIGYQATAGAANATSIGREARADHAGSIALGYQALTTQVDQVMVGPRDVEITDTTKGLVLVSPDGTRYRVTVANGGALAGGGGSPPAASETVAGIVELASPAETVTGLDDQRATTPAGVKAAIDAAVPTAPGGTVLVDRITTNQSIAAATFTAVQWNARTEVTTMNPTTNSGTRLVALVAGLHTVDTTIIFQNLGAGATEARAIRFAVTRASVTTYHRGYSGPANTSTNFTEVNAHLDMRLAVGDYVEVQAWASIALYLVTNQGTRAAMSWRAA